MRRAGARKETHLFAKNVEGRLVRCQAEHDKVGVRTVQDMAVPWNGNGRRELNAKRTLQHRESRVRFLLLLALAEGVTFAIPFSLVLFILSFPTFACYKLCYS